jgi:hypothetical protein
MAAHSEGGPARAPPRHGSPGAPLSLAWPPSAALDGGRGRGDSG